MGCKISGSAKALPAHTVTNDDLAKIVDTSDEWIVEIGRAAHRFRGILH